MEYSAAGTPMLDTDGETILIRAGGRSEDGIFYDGFIKVRPGDDRYQELLPEARCHPVPVRRQPGPGARQPDPETMAKLMRAMPTSD
jgi:hypothetical protein